MNTRPAFILFGPAHLTALALAVVVPLLLAAVVRRAPRLDGAIRFGLALLLGGGWLAWYALFAARGWLTLGNALPLNLCDWAAAALIVALLHPRRRIYELGYFWGLGGTVQGLVTPDIGRGFPDPQFIFFFINHGGIIASLLYLTLGTGLRPVPASLPRVVFASFAYAGVAAAADFLLGTNYGFLRAKPANASILDFLSPWPWYIPELVLIGFASALLYYAPFFIADRLRAYRQAARDSPSRDIVGNSRSF
jgi:hypothetical integral membrane protein (TIGR02206 family)